MWGFYLNGCVDTAGIRFYLPQEIRPAFNIDMSSIVGAGTYNQTSAMLTDASGTVVAYGKIADAAIGEKTFTILNTVAADNYTLHAFEEQVNGIKKTDYASRELTQSITISAAPVTYDVQVTAGRCILREP